MGWQAEAYYELIAEAHRDGHFEGDGILIDRMAADGWFVVAYLAEVYCRVTDAVLGTVRHFESAYLSRDEANAAVQAEEYGDRLMIYPKAAPPALPEIPIDNVPF